MREDEDPKAVEAASLNNPCRANHLQNACNLTDLVEAFFVLAFAGEYSISAYCGVL